MAKILLPIVLFVVLFSATVFVDAKSFGKVLDPVKMGLKKEKLSHFRVYWHDINAGPNPSAIRIAAAPSTNKSATGFGALVMIDNPMTEGPELSSRHLGRAQGLYASASQNDIGYYMSMNFVFSTGTYNGSVISILGRNAVFATMREMPIIGGSGLFRFARGYVQARTHYFNLKSGDAIVQYNIYVFHY